MKKIKILKNEENKIMAYCDFGDMPNSIEIEVEDEFEFKEDLQNYIFVDGKLKYNPCLETLKNKKREELKEIRKEKIDSDLEVNGDFFQVRERDLQNFYNLKIAVDLEPARATMRTAWVLADNSIKEFSFTELMGVLGAYILRKQQLFAKFGELCARLDSCNTVEEIDSIKWQ